MKLQNNDLNPSYHMKRASYHYWKDGIFEILIGIGVILYTLIFFSDVLPLFTTVIQVSLASIVVFFGIVLFRLVSNDLKERIVFPRTGFVALKHQKEKLSPRRILLTIPTIVILVPLSVIVSLGILLAFAQIHINISLVFLSAMLAFPACMIAYRTGIKRLYWVGSGIISTGIALTITNTFGNTGISILYGICGVLLILSGALALISYLRQNEIHSHGES